MRKKKKRKKAHLQLKMEEVKNSNTLVWKLDLLETKFKGFTPRLPLTKKLLTSRNSKIFKNLPSTEEEADHVILELKAAVFQKKYHGAYQKLHKEVKRFWKLNKNKVRDDNSAVKEFFTNENNISCLISSKLVKILSSEILTNKELRLDPPQYIPKEIREVVNDPSNVANPSAFFIQHCKDNKEFNTFISNLWNTKSAKTVLNEISWSFHVVKGNISEARAEKRASETKHIKGSERALLESDAGENFVSSASQDIRNNADKNIDSEDFAVRSHSVGVSSADNNIQSKGDLLLPLLRQVNQNGTDDIEDSHEEYADYNITEPDKPGRFGVDSSEDDFPEGKDLQEFPLGYISGSEEESDRDDDVVKEITSERRNRRGQRARQKIWAKKFGKEANHIKKARKKTQEEKEKRKEEYEERSKRRKLKAQNEVNKETVNNQGEANTSNKREKVNEEKNKPMHPSWQAKKLAEQKTKDANFQGKKIIFD